MATRFVFFDLGNVLIRFSLDRLLNQVSPLFKVSPERIAEVYMKDYNIQEEFESGKIDADTYYERICIQLRQKPLKSEVFRALNDIFWLNEEMIPFVSGLRKVEFPCGILSNVGPEHWNHCRVNFPEVIELIPDHRVLSFEVGAVKPHRKIYETAFEVARKCVQDILPSEILFIDDLQKNVEAALEFGFDAVTYLDGDALKKVFQKRKLPFFEP